MLKLLVVVLLFAGPLFPQGLLMPGPFIGGVGGGGGGSGTVTSVSFTGGLISVANPTTTPAFTVAGTSGGVPCFTSASTWASSSALAATSLMLGGGAGVCPSTTSTDLQFASHTLTLGSAGIVDVSPGKFVLPSSAAGTGITLTTTSGSTVISTNSAALSGAMLLAGNNTTWVPGAGGNVCTNSATTPCIVLPGAAVPNTPIAGGIGINNVSPNGWFYWYGGAAFKYAVASATSTQDLSALATGVLHNTTTTGVLSSSAIVSADLSITGTTCTNQFVSAISSSAAGTCTTVTLAGAQFANQGTTTTVLHGNAAGNPSFGAIVAADITTATITAAKMAATTFDSQTDAATITWAIASVLNAQATVTLGGNRTLNITNPVVGGNYVFKITQDGTGSRTLTKGSGCTWKELGSSAATFGLSTAASAIDVLTFTYDGTNCLASVGKAYGG